jgi:hypothetical protein
MSQNRRTSERVPVFVPTTLQLCDPHTHKPSGRMVTAVMVDVSKGGARLELNHDADGVSLERGTLLLATFDPNHVRLKDDVFLRIAWFTPKPSSDQNAHAALGAYFLELNEHDREKLLKLPGTPQKAFASPTAERRWTVLRSGIGLIIALSLYISLRNTQNLLEQQNEQLSALHTRMDKMETNVPQWVSTLRNEVKSEGITQKGTLTQLTERLAKIESGPRPAAAAPLATVVATSAVDPGALTEKRMPVQFRVASLPYGIEVNGVTAGRRSFGGVVTNKNSNPQDVILAVEYACDGPGTPSSQRCNCDARVKLPAGGRSDFTCVALLAPKQNADDLRLSVSGR